MIRPELEKRSHVFNDTWDSMRQMVIDSGHAESDWMGPSADDLAHEMLHGSKELADEASRMFDEFVDVLLPEQNNIMQERDTSPVGCSPCVPAYLAGRPDSMWRSTWDESPGLCRIYIQQNRYAGTTVEDNLRLGVACAALAYAVQTNRPVELYWFAINSSYGRKPNHLATACRLGTAPLNLSMLATALARIGIFRCHMERVKNKSYGGYSRIPPTEMFDLSDDDIIIPAVTHKDLPVMREDPLAWVKSMVANQEDARRSTKERGGR